MSRAFYFRQQDFRWENFKFFSPPFWCSFIYEIVFRQTSDDGRQQWRWRQRHPSAKLNDRLAMQPNMCILFMERILWHLFWQSVFIGFLCLCPFVSMWFSFALFYLSFFSSLSLVYFGRQMQFVCWWRNSLLFQTIRSKCFCVWNDYKSQFQ